MKQDEFHPTGFSPSNAGQANRELEGSIESFGDGGSLRKPMSGYVAGEGSDASVKEHIRTEGFVVVEEDRTTEGRPVPEIHKEDPEFLREHRVDQKDEIVPEPDLETGQEIAVLRKKKSFQPEGEASEL